MVSELSHVSNREISAMSTEVLESRLEELQEELLQLNAEKSMFLGLPLDDENQFDQTDSKIQVWTKKILTEFGILNFE